MWQSWTMAVVGVWVGIVPYLNFSLGTMKIVLLISGLVLLVLGIWDAMEVNRKCQTQS